MMTEKEQLEELKALTEWVCETDSEFYWVECDDGICRPAINVNDVFSWACAEGETVYGKDLPDIRKAIDDVATAMGKDTFSTIYGPMLWVARKNKLRPQGAAYPAAKCIGDAQYDWEALRVLFDECGPERKLGMGNPRPRPTKEDDDIAVEKHALKLIKQSVGNNKERWYEYLRPGTPHPKPTLFQRIVRLFK